MTAAKAIRILNEGPLSVVTFYAAATDQEYAEFLAEMTQLMERARGTATKRVVVHDARRWMKSTATQRQMQANWIKDHWATMVETTGGVTFVFDSGLVRGMFTALMWLTRMPTDYVITATLDESFAWARNIQGNAFPEKFAARVLSESALSLLG